MQVNICTIWQFKLNNFWTVSLFCFVFVSPRSLPCDNRAGSAQRSPAVDGPRWTHRLPAGHVPSRGELHGAALWPICPSSLRTPKWHKQSLWDQSVDHSPFDHSSCFLWAQLNEGATSACEIEIKQSVLPGSACCWSATQHTQHWRRPITRLDCSCTKLPLALVSLNFLLKTVNSLKEAPQSGSTMGLDHVSENVTFLSSLQVIPSSQEALKTTTFRKTSSTVVINWWLQGHIWLLPIKPSSLAWLGSRLHNK